MNMVYFNEQLKKYCKICPSCQKDIPYLTKKSAKRFDDGMSSCRSCSNWNKKHPQNKIYKRNCSQCNKELIYKSYRGMWRANKNDCLCLSCSHKGEKSYLYGKPMSQERKLKFSFKGRHHNDETKKKLSDLHKGEKKSEKHKEKLRMLALERVKKMGRTRGYNFKACQFIDDFGKKNGYNFQHAMNGGEIVISGYCLDGYDKEKNVIFEYDDPYHETNKYKIKDLKRSERLINKLGCNIIRYSEKFNKLYKSTSIYSEVYCA